MKVTRYFQSCLLIEDGDVRILIDPSGQEKDRDFGKLDAVLYTHEHSDHFDADMASGLVDAGTPVYANASTAKQMESQPNIANDGDEFDVAGMTIKVIELPHCPMANGSAGPQNVGYLINGKLFHPGDGRELSGLQVDNLAVPITGPDISLRDAFDFASQVKAKKAIPIHYDYIGTKPEVFHALTERFNPPFEIVVVGSGESTDL